MHDIVNALHAIRLRIAAAEARYGREPGSVALLAVSKTRPAQDIDAAYRAGQRAFGESYAQEALEKITRLQNPDLEWHFIGPLQANKTRGVAGHFAWVHSIDRYKLALRLSGQRPPGLAPLNLCLEVNISGEASKSGVPPSEVLELARAAQRLPGLRLRGLMSVPAPDPDFDRQRQSFARLRRLYDELRAAGLPLDTLSAGMTADLEAAIAEGSTLVRVGTGIFGPRVVISDS